MISFRYASILLVVLSLFILSACKQPPSGKGGKLKVVTTIAPLFSFTKNVAGDAADVENLLPSGAGPHEYSLSPYDVTKAADAQLLIINGVNLEAWLNNLVRSVNERRTDESERLIVVDTSSGIKAIDNDPHIWLSPKNAVIQVKNIMHAMIEADPENRETYRGNAAVYIERLKNLDRDIENEIKTWASKQFVSFHSAFRYFAGDYGLRQAAVIRETPEVEPSPRHIARVIETIKREGIRSVFTEPQISHKIVESIAEDLDLEVYSLDTMETGPLSEEWYEEKTRENVAVLKKALKEGK